MAKVAAKAKDRPVKKKQTVGMKILTILFSIVSVFYVAPVFIVLMNSFKSNAAISRAIFEFPNADSFQGFQSYMTGMFHGNYPFWKSIVWSFFITIGGVVLILFCTSMCAWYLQRSNSRICKSSTILHFLNGYSFPDGNVYPLKDSRQSQAYNSVGYFDYIPRIRSRTCGIYVLGIC